MNRSPIENNPRPTLRGTSTCFRGSPGGSKVPTTYPPYPLFYSSVLLSSSLRAVRTVKACEGYCKWCTSSKYSEVIMSFCWFAPSIRKPFIMFCQVTFLPLVESFFIMCYRLVCSFVTNLFICVLQRFAECFEQGLENGFGQGFGVRIYLPFWYVGCQMRLEPVFLIFGKPRGILYFSIEHV